MGSERPTVRRLDTESVRALAHPLRVRIVGQLRRRGPATATTLARALGESSGATSYHLRALARYGFVVDDPTRGSGRERWWQAAQGMTSWRPEDFAGDPEAEAAEEWLSGFHARTAMELIDGWMRRRPDADPAWVSAAEQNDYLLTMTPDEVRAMLAEVDEVVLRHRAASIERPADEDARPLRLLVFAVPDADDPPDAGADADAEDVPATAADGPPEADDPPDAGANDAAGGLSQGADDPPDADRALPSGADDPPEADDAPSPSADDSPEAAGAASADGAPLTGADGPPDAAGAAGVPDADADGAPAPGAGPPPEAAGAADAPPPDPDVPSVADDSAGSDTDGPAELASDVDGPASGHELPEAGERHDDPGGAGGAQRKGDRG